MDAMSTREPLSLHAPGQPPQVAIRCKGTLTPPLVSTYPPGLISDTGVNRSEMQHIYCEPGLSVKHEIFERLSPERLPARAVPGRQDRQLRDGSLFQRDKAPDCP
jgi:hypothetical protein